MFDSICWSFSTKQYMFESPLAHPLQMHKLVPKILVFLINILQTLNKASPSFFTKP